MNDLDMLELAGEAWIIATPATLLGIGLLVVGPSRDDCLPIPMQQVMTTGIAGGLITGPVMWPRMPAAAKAAMVQRGHLLEPAAFFLILYVAPDDELVQPDCAHIVGYGTSTNASPLTEYAEESTVFTKKKTSRNASPPAFQVAYRQPRGSDPPEIL